MGITKTLQYQAIVVLFDKHCNLASTDLILVGLPADVAPADALHLHDDRLDLLVADLLQDADGAGLESGTKIGWVVVRSKSDSDIRLEQ